MLSKRQKRCVLSNQLPASAFFMHSSHTARALWLLVLNNSRTNSKHRPSIRSLSTTLTNLNSLKALPIFFFLFLPLYDRSSIISKSFRHRRLYRFISLRPLSFLMIADFYIIGRHMNSRPIVLIDRRAGCPPSTISNPASSSTNCIRATQSHRSTLSHVSIPEAIGIQTLRFFLVRRSAGLNLILA